MKVPIMKIGKYEFSVPINLGPMGVRISGPPLVAAVLNQGMMGTLTTMVLADMVGAMKEEEFVRVSELALIQNISRLKELTDKPFAINVMGALSNTDELIRAAVKYGANIITYGAGIPKNLPMIVADPEVALGPIISSARLASIILKLWQKYDRLPDFFVIEGPKAGGHLGFKANQLYDSEYDLKNILKQTLKVVEPYEQSLGRKIPLIVAGGIYTGRDIAEMLTIGAAGVQMATRFVATHECPVHDNFKQAYVNASSEDIVIIKSPVGMPGRAIRNKFLIDLEAGKIPRPYCPYHCIHSCKRGDAGYCIAERLIKAFTGDVDNGLIFAGTNVHRINKIVSVKELVNELVSEIENY